MTKINDSVMRRLWIKDYAEEWGPQQSAMFLTSSFKLSTGEVMQNPLVAAERSCADYADVLGYMHVREDKRLGLMSKIVTNIADARKLRAA